MNGASATFLDQSDLRKMDDHMVACGALAEDVEAGADSVE